MALPGLTTHRKFYRLERALGSAALAMGHLELMWHAAYANANDYLGDEVDVEATARWAGEPGVLFRALLSAGGEDGVGFIEEVPGRPGRYQVHDLYDHAPEYVHDKMERAAARKAAGKTLSELRSEAGRKGAQALHGKRLANAGQLPGKPWQIADPPSLPPPAKPVTPPPPTPAAELEPPEQPVAVVGQEQQDELWEAVQRARSEAGLGPDERPAGWACWAARAVARAPAGWTPAEAVHLAAQDFVRDKTIRARNRPAAVFCRPGVWDSRLPAARGPAPPERSKSELDAEWAQQLDPRDPNGLELLEQAAAKGNTFAQAKLDVYQRRALG